MAAIICFIAALTSLFIFQEQKRTDVKGISQKANSTVTISPSSTTTPSAVVMNAYVAAAQPVATVTTVPTQLTQNSGGQTRSEPNSTPPATPTQANQTLQVKLTINGTTAGEVTFNQGANQCDVLTAAHDQGKITSLLMKYDNNLGTNAVYQINGIGKENSVWWVYKVNGQAPGQGCSLVKANSGDNIEWNYLGN
ncbi:MAG TPA: DUF4430 domain-containing protein [Patescibacteria group bacterium]